MISSSNITATSEKIEDRDIDIENNSNGKDRYGSNEQRKGNKDMYFSTETSKSMVHKIQNDAEYIKVKGK